jgi:hypothetical protein
MNSVRDALQELVDSHDRMQLMIRSTDEQNGQEFAALADGYGLLWDNARAALSKQEAATPAECPICRGTGREGTPGAHCFACDGTGKFMRGAALKAAQPVPPVWDRAELFAFLAHGDGDHRAWLADAIEAFFTGKPRPEPKTAAPQEPAEPRACTCHPDDNPPRPCPRKYALSECRAQSVADAQDAGRDVKRRLREQAAHMRENAKNLSRWPDAEGEARARELAASYVEEIANVMDMDEKVAAMVLDVTKCDPKGKE